MKMTIGEVCEVTGYTTHQLRNLCESGIVVPEQSGKGAGCFRYFSTLQVVGICFCRLAVPGQPREVVERVLDFFLNMTERELRQQFRKGRTHLIPHSEPLKLIRWPDRSTGHVFDVRLTYEAVQEGIARLVEEGKAERHRTGRSRGLATAAR